MRHSSSLAEKTVLLLTAAAFALRLAYTLHSHPFIDEFTTVLAARAILRRALPVLPSGLFYEHGLLFSYLDAPFVELAGEQLLFAVVRLPSLLISTATVPFLYWLGRKWQSPQAGLVAAALLAVSPEGMVWGGRARMYALAQLLVLFLAFLVYEGSRGEGRSRFRWLALLTLLATLLTQFGALILVPPLIVGGLVVGWLTRPPGSRPWFLQRMVLAEGGMLVVVVGLGVLVKRLGQPLGAAPLGDHSMGKLLTELIGTVTYQTGLVLDGESVVKLLARQFGVPHHIWLTLIAVAGGLLSLALWFSARAGPPCADQPRPARGGPGGRQSSYSLFYLWLVFGLSVFVMVTLLESWRRNPRYLVMALPLFYLIVAGSVEQFSPGLAASPPSLPRAGTGHPGRTVPARGRLDGARRGAGNLQYPTGVLSLFSKLRRQVPVALFLFIVVQAGLLVPDLRIAYRTPEPAYEEAFRYVADQWQPGDVLLTMNTSAVGLYLGEMGNSPQESYRFAIQQDATQFLLNSDTQPVDRWLGVPWIGTAADFNRVLNEHLRTWFVVDTIRLPVYYRGDWLATLDSRMALVWSQDEALVYLTRPDGTPVPTDPDMPLNARFGNMVALKGYSLAPRGDHPLEQVGPCEAGPTLCLEPGDSLQVTLFWQAIAPVDADYTIFIHVRNEQKVTVAQRDSQPFDGLYPTSQWRVGEIVALPLEVELPLDLAGGKYSLYVGLYRLDTMTRLEVDRDLSAENAVILDEAVVVVPEE